jgi:hypothetical protein
VGVSPGTAITGSPLLIEGEVVGDSADFAESVLVAHTNLMAFRDEDQTMAIEMGGLTFTPGTYRSGSAINFAYGTTVTLDGENQANPVFRFIAGSTLVTAADTKFILKNGAKAENVLWALGSGATLGANSVVEGSILAGTAGSVAPKSAITQQNENVNGVSIVSKAVGFLDRSIVLTLLSARLQSKFRVDLR